ncbi:MAG: helix-turn-helix transcriptional regulator [Geminicoccaceae bacterium]
MSRGTPLERGEKQGSTGLASIGDLASVVAAIGEADFDRRLLSWLGRLVAFDSALVLLYAERQRPIVLVDALDNPGRKNSVEHYLEGAYLLDPFYRQASASNAARLLKLADIVPEDFSRSDYFETYYRSSAIRDEVNFLLPIDDGTYAVALERAARGDGFSEDDLTKLSALLPLVDALVRRHRSIISEKRAPDVPDREHLRLERVLVDFGSDVLTPREQQVAGLMLRGYALAQIAERLDISSETARVHRRHIYEKLGISSLAELFSSALAELAASR